MCILHKGMEMTPWRSLASAHETDLLGKPNLLKDPEPSPVRSAANPTHRVASVARPYVGGLLRKSFAMHESSKCNHRCVASTISGSKPDDDNLRGFEDP